jgi:diguanylate cyclase (GGDEF)-like protein
MSSVLDTQKVRENFRRISRVGTRVAVVTMPVHAILLGSVDQPVWRWSAAAGFVLIALSGFIGNSRRFAVFLAALLGCILVILAHQSLIALSFGRSVGATLPLLCLLPLVAVSGRIDVREKWVIAVAIGAGIVTLDLLSRDMRGSLPPVPAEFLRAMNWGVVTLVVTGLTYHYFALVTVQQSALQLQAMTDPLTKLANRRHVESEGGRLAQRTRGMGQSLLVMLCDIDHFKSINDRFGHDVGDKTLERVAETIRLVVRQTDIAARWGGEEFLILLPGIESDHAMLTAERMRRKLAGVSIPVKGQHINITVTIGATALGPHESLEAAIARADRSLYEGKVAGRNRVILAPAPTGRG